jgi:hypothetical protein
MGRTESKQAAQQGMAQSAQDQANAQADRAATNKSLGDYKTSLNNFMNFGRKTFGANGEYMRDQNTLANTTAAAGQTNLTGNLALNAMRTGENTAGYAGTAAESQRQSSKDLTNQLATADSDRLKQLTGVEQFGVQASSLPASVQAGLYGTSSGGSGNQLGSAANAAKTPGFWDTFAPALAQGAGTAAAGFCPCAGSMILMADGSTKPVEELKKGDFLWALSTSAPPNEVRETPQPMKTTCFSVTTKNGRKHRGSSTHTLALAIGGYAFMRESLGQVVLAERETDIIAQVADIGVQDVYPLMIGGSHTYQADGIWILS